MGIFMNIDDEVVLISMIDLMLGLWSFQLKYSFKKRNMIYSYILYFSEKYYG